MNTISRTAGVLSAAMLLATGLAGAGTIDGKPLTKTQPKLKGQLADIDAFISWTMAREGKLALRSGYDIDVDGATIKLDAYDPERNIGYLYADSQDPERMQLGEQLRGKFQKWSTERHAAILFIEVRHAPDAETLHGKVIKFLHDVQQHPPRPAKPGAKR